MQSTSTILIFSSTASLYLVRGPLSGHFFRIVAVPTYFSISSSALQMCPNHSILLVHTYVNIQLVSWFPIQLLQIVIFFVFQMFLDRNCISVQNIFSERFFQISPVFYYHRLSRTKFVSDYWSQTVGKMNLI